MAASGAQPAVPQVTATPVSVPVRAPLSGRKLVITVTCLWKGYMPYGCNQSFTTFIDAEKTITAGDVVDQLCSTEHCSSDITRLMNSGGTRSIPWETEFSAAYPDVVPPPASQPDGNYTLPLGVHFNSLRGAGRCGIVPRPLNLCALMKATQNAIPRLVTATKRVEREIKSLHLAIPDADELTISIREWSGVNDPATTRLLQSDTELMSVAPQSAVAAISPAEVSALAVSTTAAATTTTPSIPALYILTISGPLASRDSPFVGGRFQLLLEVTAEYPLKPPRVMFLTPIYHPLIGRNGQLFDCRELTGERWSPGYTFRSLPQLIWNRINSSHPAIRGHLHGNRLEDEIDELKTEQRKNKELVRAIREKAETYPVKWWLEQPEPTMERARLFDDERCGFCAMRRLRSWDKPGIATAREWTRKYAEFVRWSPHTHALFSPKFRRTVLTVLVIARARKPIAATAAIATSAPAAAALRYASVCGLYRLPTVLLYAIFELAAEP